jgi:membrane protein DedA with SNARE-associated domain
MQNFISHYGYIAVFLLMLAESACIPVPSEVTMMFGGALAAGAFSTGVHPLLIGIVVAGVLGNVVGSYIAWAVGKYAGQAAIHRWGRRIGIREHEIDRATAWFERHGSVAVLVGRIVPVIRTFISLPAGFADMPAVKFGVYTTLGVIPWTAALGIAGYALGKNWEHVAKDFNGPTYAIAGILVVAIVIAVVMYRRRRNAAEASGSYGSSGPDGNPGQSGYTMNAGNPVPSAPGYQSGGPASYGSQAPTPYPGQAPSPQGGWGPGGGAQPGGARPDDPRPASSPWDQQYR